MKKSLCRFFAVAACIVMASGCGADSGNGKNEDGGMPETAAGAPDTVEGTREASREEETGSTETDSAEDAAGADNAAGAYGGILDMFYYKILGGWDGTEDVSYMFYWDYTSVKSLSDAGYALTDLDGDGVPELLVSTVEAAGEGMIYDLYAIADGEVVHTATSGERYCYYLCEDNTIYYWGSSGASISSQVNYGLDPDTGLLYPKEAVAYNENINRDNPWFYGTGECYSRENGPDFEHMSGITETEAKEICDKYQVKAIGLTLFDEYSPQEGMPDELALKQAFLTAASPETGLYFAYDDFDGDGTKEAFGITGTDDGYGLENAKIYYADPDGAVSLVDTIPYLYGYGGIYPGMDMNLIMDAGNAKFMKIGGADGQETWLYGVRDKKAYQPEVSGQHADFGKTEDGQYTAQPHEGGEGYYIIYYDYDPATGEFIQKDTGGSAAVPETEEKNPGHEHSYTGTVTAEPSCVDEGIMTYACPCGDTYTETIEPAGHDWKRKQETVSHESSGNKETTTVRVYSVCSVCGATRPY